MELNHTIVHATDNHAAARFLAEMLALGSPRQLGPFAVVQVGPTSLDFLDSEPPIREQHFAFLGSEAEFDAVVERIQARGLPYWADPHRREPGRINHWDDGRGVYFNDPDGHLLEVITRPYGSAGTAARQPHPLVNAEV